MSARSDPAGHYTQIGIALSFYSAKTRSYLLHKGIPFVERGPTLAEFAVGLRRRTGAAALPVLVTPQGEWLQDSSVIIDTLERRFPERPALPPTPRLRIATLLIELWADELWIPLAMHTRWSHPENIDFFIEDAAQSLLPGLPMRIRRIAARQVAGKMQSYLPAVGVLPAFHAVMDAFIATQLDALDAHFRANRFVFGERPCLADFALAGPLWAHLGRDPWPARELIAPRAALAAWVRRTMDPASATGELRADDTVPETLAPMFASLIADFVPLLRAGCEAVRASPRLPADTRRAPRTSGTVDYPLGAGLHRREVMSYPVWMLRRLFQHIDALDAQSRAQVIAWLDAVGGSALLELDPPPVRRVGLAAAHVAPEAAEGSGRPC